MSWFADLTPYTYLDTADDGVTVCAGWLEPDHEFPVGPVSPRALARLKALIAHAHTQATRGFYICHFCGDREARSKAEIRVVGSNGRRFASPVLIAHYIEAHGYQPPAELVAACEAAPDSVEVRAGVCFACGDSLVAGKIFRGLVDRQGVWRMSVYHACATCGVDYARGGPDETLRTLERELRHASAVDYPEAARRLAHELLEVNANHDLRARLILHDADRLPHDSTHAALVALWVGDSRAIDVSWGLIAVEVRAGDLNAFEQVMKRGASRYLESVDIDGNSSVVAAVLGRLATSDLPWLDRIVLRSVDLCDLDPALVERVVVRTPEVYFDRRHLALPGHRTLAIRGFDEALGDIVAPFVAMLPAFTTGDIARAEAVMPALIERGVVEVCCVGPLHDEMHDAIDWIIVDVLFADRDPADTVLTVGEADLSEGCDYFVNIASLRPPMLVAFVADAPELATVLLASVR